jgi:DNA-binding transcriptional MocR family regulator
LLLLGGVPELRFVPQLALGRAYRSVLAFTPPHGGMSVWARAPTGTDVGAWVERAHAAGVAFQHGQRFALTGRAPYHARLGFAACTERELVEAVRRMAATDPRR